MIALREIRRYYFNLNYDWEYLPCIQDTRRNSDLEVSSFTPHWIRVYLYIQTANRKKVKYRSLTILIIEQHSDMVIKIQDTELHIILNKHVLYEPMLH